MQRDRGRAMAPTGASFHSEEPRLLSLRGEFTNKQSMMDPYSMMEHPLQQPNPHLHSWPTPPASLPVPQHLAAHPLARELVKSICAIPNTHLRALIIKALRRQFSQAELSFPSHLSRTKHTGERGQKIKFPQRK